MKQLIIFLPYFTLAVLTGLISNESIAQNINKTEVEALKAMKLKATKALNDFPSVSAINASNNLSKNGKILLKQIRLTYEKVNNANFKVINKNEYDALMDDLSWTTAVMNGIVMNLQNDGGGPDKGATCVTTCRKEYNQCLGENHCENDGWVCLCCIPCSLQYGGCIGHCIIDLNGSKVKALDPGAFLFKN